VRETYLWLLGEINRLADQAQARARGVASSSQRLSARAWKNAFRVGAVTGANTAYRSACQTVHVSCP
jgi:hypothetical protein